MPDWLKILIPSILGFGTTIGAAFLTARWATKRAFEQRWWERKEQAYSEIVEALHDMIRYADLCAEDYLTHREEDHPKKKEFGENYTKAYWNIQRATDIGAFLISDEAAGILEALRKRPKLKWEENPPWEIYEEDSKHYRDALAAIRKCAKTDLRV